MKTTKPGIGAAPRWAPWRTHAFWPDALPRGLFVAELLARGLCEIACDSFQIGELGSKLGELGEPVLVRADPAGKGVEAFLRLANGEVALIDAGYGQATIEVAARSREGADAAAAALKRTLASEPPAAERVSMAFWIQGQRGGDVRHREIEAPAFDEIAPNYPGAVREALSQLMQLRNPERGRLILWRGEPGTGKSHALRALARHWASWCSTHFIMDPEELFGRGGAYMLDVLTWNGDTDEDRWRLVILEDSGELIAADARTTTGQALSRLLNVADGLLGQGTRTLIVITTNEPLKRLHPATRRAGRCLADIEFRAFSVDEANAWLAAHERDDRVQRPTPLAELYGRSDDVAHQRDEPSPGFGFARELATAARYDPDTD